MVTRTVSGRTSFNAGHDHSYEVKICYRSNKVKGETSFDNGHLHQINTTLDKIMKTETDKEHYHTFSIDSWQGMGII